jgi:preprotein translocase subunit YajC
MFDTILLQTQTTNSNAWLFQLLILGGMLLVMYLFFFLPQQRKQNDQKRFRDSLKVGDEVVTIGGLYAKIHAIDEDKNTITLIVDKGTKLIFDRFSISMEATKRIQAKS